MPLAEGIAARVAYKAYASGLITPGIESDPVTDLGASGSKILRRVSANLNLTKDSFESNEVRTDYQRADMRHTTRRTQGSISGELSPATYFELIEAVHRDTATAAVSRTKTEFTSIAASATASTITMGGGDPVAQGLRVGDIIRLAAAAIAANNGRNFVITGMGGTGNRTLSVWPAPADAVADTGAWTLTRPGKSTIVPSTGHVRRKFGFEIFNQDIAAGRLFTESRMTGYRMNMPVNGANTIELNMTGRGMRVLKGAGAPFFTNPAQPTTTGVTGPIDGVALINGVRVGLLTSLDLTMALAASTADVRAQKFAAEVFLGKAALNGNFSLFLENMDMADAFVDEAEIQLLTTVASDATAGAEGIAILLPRIKLSGCDLNTDGEGGQMVTSQFSALKYQGSAAGVDQTTIRIHDTAAA